MTDPPPRLVAALSDRYRIERELGQGGMATVYLAEDLRHHRKVAVKVLRPELSAAVGAERFLREIRIAANLTHPHIVPLHDSGQVDDSLYYVMPYLEGESLGARLRREGPLPLEEGVRLLREVADALAFAHERGIVHRDIKPENVMLSGGHALVADFGVARAVSDGTDAGGLTSAGVAVGTPAYMAPEQATADPAIDHRADIYALGTLAYEMLAGRTPFSGANPQALLAAQVLQAPDPVSRHRADCPAELEQLVMRCLAKEPRERFQTAGDLRAECDRLPRSGEHRTPAAGARPAADGIVVLPFANQSPDPENEYFTDGLTEELIADLAKVRALRVISRTSSLQLKGTTKTIPAIGRELGVRYVLEGSVRRAGPSLRITARLLDAGSDAQLWAEKYSGTMEDVFDVQERVSRAIVDALNVTLSSDEDRRLADRPIQDVRAFELFLQARQELRRYNVERGMGFLQQAIAIEGEVPALRALRAQGLVTQVRAGVNRDLQPLEEAEAEARALIALAPDASYGYAILGFVDYERGNLRESFKSLSAAMERDPNDADSHFYLGITLIAAGQHEAARQLSLRLSASDPLSPIAGMLAGVASWFVGRPAEGLPPMEQSLALDPDSIIHRWTLGYHYALVGRFADAGIQARWLQERAPLLPYTVQLRALLAAVEGRTAEALDSVSRVDTSALDGHHKFHLAEVFALAGDAPRALALFEQAVDTSFYPHQFFAAYCPFIASLRGRPEFERILAKAAKRVAEFSA